MKDNKTSEYMELWTYIELEKSNGKNPKKKIKQMEKIWNSMTDENKEFVKEMTNIMNGKRP
jgi:hypothetical protein